MGPEHSSARIERFLQLAAQNNMEIIYPTLAAQLFHALRRQALKSNKCPLIIFAPKALLRQPAAYSKLSDLTDQGFQDLVIHEPEPTNGVTHLVLTTGQFVHEVLKIQKENAQANLAVARIEKLYPLDPQAFQALWNRYPRLEKVIYAQDEPMNMGALNYVEKFLQVHFPKYSIECISRPESASTAAGSSVLHQHEESRIIDQLIKKL
jgi:2-oxoglutarate dehydrogenase E1 component